MTEAKYQVALIGCGKFGTKRAQALLRLPRVELASLYDMQPSKAQALSQQLQCPWTNNLDDILSSNKINVVIVATPNRTHYSLCLKLLRSGKHVLCEKPIAIKLSWAKKLKQASKKSGTVLKVGANFRHFPSVQYIRENIQAFDIGNIEELSGSIGHNGTPIEGVSWYKDAKLSGGGTLLDNGIHLVDLFQKLAGPFSKSKVLECKRNRKAVESYIKIKCNNDAVTAYIESSWSKYEGYAEINIKGSRGSVFSDVTSDKVTIINVHGEKTVTTKAAYHSIEAELRYFFNCLDDSLSPSPCIDEGIGSLNAVMNAYENLEATT